MLFQRLADNTMGRRFAVSLVTTHTPTHTLLYPVTITRYNQKKIQSIQRTKLESRLGSSLWSPYVAAHVISAVIWSGELFYAEELRLEVN